MRALSGLTPALSRRLQRQLLAHLPPAAARSLRRTLSLQARQPRVADAYVRSNSASADPPDTPATPADTTAPADPPAPAEPIETPSAATTPVSPVSLADRGFEQTSPETPSPQFSTLPRLRRRSTPRESTPPILAAVDVDCSPTSTSTLKEPTPRRATDRPLLSKYLTPERAYSLDESYAVDAGSILSEPSYIAAYGSPALGGGAPALRRHSLRHTGDQPRKRVSRFLRSDFFDTPGTDESLYVKHKKEKELETQKILKEIREKRNKSLEANIPRDQVETEFSPSKEEMGRKSLSPSGLLAGKERSRSNTPFFPILDNIKETSLDASTHLPRAKLSTILNDNKKTSFDETSCKESRLTRPKSYPIKTLDSIEEPTDSNLSENGINKIIDSKESKISKESKLIRPKSYPASSPSPEKVYINRNVKKDDLKSSTKSDDVPDYDIKSDVEVSFSITLPKKNKAGAAANTKDSPELNIVNKIEDNKDLESVLYLKRYQVTESNGNTCDRDGQTNIEHGAIETNTQNKPSDEPFKAEDVKAKVKVTNSSKKEESSLKSSENETSEKKGTIKKKIIRKVSSKSKTDLGQEANDTKSSTDKKKVTKKIKEKSTDDDSTSTPVVTKKKSVLQSIGQKLEKFATTKSSSPEKVTENVANDVKKNSIKLNRMQREQSVPVNAEPPTESNLIKRAVTLTDVAALENEAAPNNNKTTVSKVLGLFKKFEPRDKSKSIVEKSQSKTFEENAETRIRKDSITESASEELHKEKPRRPTSLLLNGLGRKNKYNKTPSDSDSAANADDDQTVLKIENESKNIRNSLKLDFSRLPRVKKIVPTNPVIEPQIMNISSANSENDKKDLSGKYYVSLNETSTLAENAETLSRSRSRSRSSVSNSEIKSDNSGDNKMTDRNPASPCDNTTHLLRSHESVTPETEDIVDRIRRKSFYSRFNEKKQRRKSSLVGPGAAEYDPVARIHATPTEAKYDVSPTSPTTYDVSPGMSVASDLSPSTERYRSLLGEVPVSTRSNLRFDNYGLNDKIDTYRSLDRNEFRKYPGSRSYLDYDQPLSYGAPRYSRTKSLLESSDGTDDNSLTHSIRDPQKYNRTISMYSPGNYATYRPKRTRNSAIILKESEKEPSPENILEKIRQRKNFSISVTRKPETDKESRPRSIIPSKSEGDGAECSEKVD
ncbi:hypothetical protein O3G_MSEX007536 [Manduca sexta]|nr:hypothetical protein O3G_MSEX007536 [Manduca sexta]KAG6452243.1 hypothetical protein O3G_MSEX007536 [Manduca sexta]